jgi:hypothetical protein
VNSAFLRDQGIQRRLRAIGAALAFAMWAPFAVVFVATARTSADAFLSLVLAGFLVCPVVAALLAPMAARTVGLAYRVAVLFAIGAVALGSIVQALLFALVAGLNPADVPGLAVVGLIFMGLPLLLIGFNLALAWTAFLRFALTRIAGPSGPESVLTRFLSEEDLSQAMES